MVWQALTRYASVWTKHSRSLLYVNQPQLFGLYVRMTGSILLGPFCSWGYVCFIYNAWPGTYKVKNLQCMEFAIFSTGTCMTDQFISSVKICTLHIREVKCNVSLQIHSYSKHEANAIARKTQRDRLRRRVV